MNVKEILLNYLQQNGYDGLLSIEGDCFCTIDNLCDEQSFNNCDCVPAYKWECDKCFLR